MAEEFFSGVKGIGYTPGELGFQKMVYPGKRAVNNQLTNFKGGKVGDYVQDMNSAGTSYWWNLDRASDANADIYKIATGSINYANPARDTALTKDALSQGVHTQHGMSPQQFESASTSPQKRGSIVFSRLDSDWTDTFSEIDQATDGLQTGRPAKPFRVQSTPANLEYTTQGPRNFNGETSLRQANFHDWMKSFAQNIKDTLPEGGLLPKGTQELLDAPTMEEGTTAFRRYLDSAGKTINYPEARLTSIMPDEDGLIQFEYKDPQRGMVTGRTRRSSVDEFFTGSRPQALGSPVQDIASRVQPQTATISAGKAVGGTSDAVARVAAQEASGVVAPAARRAIEETASGVISPKTLKGILQAGETAAKIMRL